MIKSLKHWIADRSELIWRAEYAERQLVQADYVLAAKHDAMISASERSERLAAENSALRLDATGAKITITKLTAERDAALAKLAPPARDPVTGRWAKAS
jgi:hypothetical protein